MERSIYLAVPHTGAIAAEALPGLAYPCRGPLQLGTGKVSLLALNFNRLWCAALNTRAAAKLTHFAMHHSDIAAPEMWLDRMVDELERVGADVLSAVVPLKDDRGLTTTAIGNGKTMAIRRLTLSEVRKLPPTFGLADLPAGPGDRLLVNTGLWVCRFTESWVEKVCFHVRDQVRRTPTGKFEAVCLSEDWDFSVWAHDNGLKVKATTIVPVTHFGVTGYSTTGLAGRWATDRGDDPE